MPAAVPIIAAAAAKITAAAIAKAVLTLAVTMAIGSYNASRQRKKAANAERDAYNASLRDRNVTIRSGISTRKYVIGEARVGGTLMHIDANGWENTALDSIVALAANKCDLIGYFIGDEHVLPANFPGERYGHRQLIDRMQTTLIGGTTTITLEQEPADPAGVRALDAGLGFSLPVSVNGREVTVTAPSGSLFPLRIVYQTLASTKMRSIYKNGDPNQTAEGWPDIATPLWSGDHRLRGVAYLRTLMLWDENIYEGGAPEIGAVLRGGDIDGHPIYDHRTGAYLTQTSNPAIRAAWWMTLPRSRGGMGIPESWIDWPYVAEASNICDELIRVRTADGSGYEWIKRYECHTVLDTAESPVDNLDIILSAMAGRRVFTAGRYRIFAGAFRPATIVLTDKDVVGDKDIVVDRSGASETPPNIVTGTFVDARKNWQESSPRPVRNDSYVAMDGAESPLDMTLAATTDERQANYLMGVALESGRPAFSFTLSVTGIGEDLALMDTVQIGISNNTPYAGKTFEILDRVDNWDGTFDLVLSEIRPNTYALDPDTFTPTDPVPIPDTSYLWNVSSITGFVALPQKPQALADGTAVTRVDMAWDLHPQPYVRQGGRIELRFRAPDGEWIGIAPVGGDSVGTSFTAALIDGKYYQFQARAVNGVGAASNWTDGWVGYDGVIDPPPPVASLTTTSIVFGIGVAWEFPQSRNAIEKTELRHGLTGVFADSVPLGDFAYPTNRHTLYVGQAGSILYFWARLTDKNGMSSPWFPTGAGVQGQSSVNAVEILDYFNDLIGRDQLAIGLVEDIGAEIEGGIAENIFNDIFGPLAGEDDEYAGDDVIFAGTKTVITNVADGDLALSQKIDAQVSKINSNTAAILEESTTRATQFDAMAEQVTTVAAQTAVNQAAVQSTTTALATLDGELEATWTVQAQVTEDGKVYSSGMALGAYKQPGQPVQTSVYFLADRFAFLNLINGVISTPFVIQGGQTFINQAFIGTAWIQTAHISDAAITNAKIVNLSVTNAKIDNAAITNAKIGNLEVDTLKIGNNAVTVHGSASAPAGEYFANNGRTISVGMSFVATADVTVLVSAEAKANVNLRHEILVDGNVVWSQDNGNGGWWGSSPDFPGMYWTVKVSVGAGARTFQLRQTVNQYNSGAKNVPPITIVCLGAMK